jgi:uncharacterized protein (DUF924 family)
VTTDTTAGGAWIERVLGFWFTELEPAAWFKPDAPLDETVRSRFLPTYTSLAESLNAAAAASSAEEALASVIVLDQFPRNMFRGTARAFAADHLALSVSRTAIDRELDKGLDTNRRLFLYLPFEHSEQLSDQHRAVELMDALGDDRLLQYAVAHRDIIARFGRFPHRNAILGRPSTSEEIEFLEKPGNKFW